MAKSMRSKREKRLRAIRREMVDPFYDKKDAAKLAAQEAALAAPKLPVRPSPFTSNISNMDVAPASTSTAADAAMDVEMDAGSQSMMLKPVGGIGKKFKKNSRLGRPSVGVSAGSRGTATFNKPPDLTTTDRFYWNHFFPWPIWLDSSLGIVAILYKYYFSVI